ncbi:unnamed protein product [Schistocephalus solidus]|uniref:C1q domain-containing protein n=1 Tax=Schistocephalus solidus TaxID=70667 RepID=A0A183TFA2_SCHSO|nr:unnamed protein product [Schistocephalus solidus]
MFQVFKRLLHTGEKTVAQEDKFYCASCVPSTCLLAPLGGDVVPPDDFGGHNGDNFWHSADGKTIGSGDVPNFKTSTSCLGRTEKTTFLPPNSVNGTGELTVNVGEGDISTNQKFDHDLGPETQKCARTLHRWSTDVVYQMGHKCFSGVKFIIPLPPVTQE